MAILIEGPDVAGVSPNHYILLAGNALTTALQSGPVNQPNSKGGNAAQAEMDTAVGKLGPVVAPYDAEALGRMIQE